jgi:hypothetical protein
MGLQDFKNIFLRGYVCNQRRNEPFEENFVKNYTDFLVEPSDPYPVKLFLILIRPGQKVRDPAGTGSTTLSSRTCTVPVPHVPYCTTYIYKRGLSKGLPGTLNVPVKNSLD